MESTLCGSPRQPPTTPVDTGPGAHPGLGLWRTEWAKWLRASRPSAGGWPSVRDPRCRGHGLPPQTPGTTRHPPWQNHQCTRGPEGQRVTHDLAAHTMHLSRSAAKISDSEGSPQRDDRPHRRSCSRSPVSLRCAGETPAEREEQNPAEAAVPGPPPAGQPRKLLWFMLGAVLFLENQTPFRAGSLGGAPDRIQITNSKTKTLIKDIEVLYTTLFTATGISILHMYLQIAVRLRVRELAALLLLETITVPPPETSKGCHSSGGCRTVED